MTQEKTDLPQSGLLNAFTAHPAEVGESYGTHFVFALRFAGRLFAAGGAALVHAVIPALCETTASRAVRDMHEALGDRSGHGR
ncbi:DUF6356 family protein [Thalassococcus sp. S3]|uniref:DUF6356 family protein n=1 Tax=Thalassococcus sp. S3 TaxID=2017482 RepID=UPI001024024C|nr:DUF6356 family protein [Thalassococcus sp. S3]QBF30304.1 hypothetical protein CFI11_03615 [Thalassococcus sp. S3]